LDFALGIKMALGDDTVAFTSECEAAGLATSGTTPPPYTGGLADPGLANHAREAHGSPVVATALAFGALLMYAVQSN